MRKLSRARIMRVLAIRLATLPASNSAKGAAKMDTLAQLEELRWLIGVLALVVLAIIILSMARAAAIEAAVMDTLQRGDATDRTRRSGR